MSTNFQKMERRGHAALKCPPKEGCWRGGNRSVPGRGGSYCGEWRWQPRIKARAQVHNLDMDQMTHSFSHTVQGQKSGQANISKTGGISLKKCLGFSDENPEHSVPVCGSPRIKRAPCTLSKLSSWGVTLARTCLSASRLCRVFTSVSIASV